MPVLKPSVASRIAAANAPNGVGKYLTTYNYCRCPDHQYRKRACKHIAAFRLLFMDEEPQDLCQCGVPWCNGDHQEEGGKDAGTNTG